MSRLAPILRRLVSQEGLLLGLTAGILLMALWLDPSFLRLKVQLKLSENIWELAILCLPMTLIIITAGIDLSVGSTMALATVALGMGVEAGLPLGACIALALLTGAACGAFNGAFIAGLKIHPLSITLATLAAYRGMAEGLSRGFSVSPPESLQALSGSFAGLPVSAWLFLVLAVAFHLALRHAPVGRQIYAMGHNIEVCRFSGVPVRRILFSIYTLSGLLAGLAAVLYAARRNTANPSVGQNMELDVITAVVIGGCSIYGGKGSIAGTLVGVLLIHELREFASWHWSKDQLNLMLLGGLLIGSVLAYQALVRKQSRNRKA